MIKETLLSQALERPGNKIGYFVGEQLAKRYYLKELMLTSLMRWINEPIGSAMDSVTRAQVALLQEQMGTTEEAAAAAA